MSGTTSGTAHARALATLLLLAVWASYLSLGLKYAAILSAALCAALLLRRQAWVGLRHAPGLAATVLLLGWLATTALWSPAPWRLIGGHLWMYGLLLLVPLIASACRPAVARRCLQHFAIVSALVGTLFIVAGAGLLPTLPVAWHTTVDAEGNQRIATSILLALGACLALWHALNPGSAVRWGWAVAGSASLAGVALQDRRTGMLLLPVLLLAWALARQPTWGRRLTVAAAIGLAALAAWQVSDGVRARFAEGLTELRQFTSDDRVANSWGQRLRMWERTAEMVQERPLTGHGLGSWQSLWQQRVTPGTALIEHTTPHNEYLLLAQQAGALGVGLWLWLLIGSLRRAMGAGASGVPALMVWTALAWVGLFNAVLRDAKFSLPLLLLAALAVAAARDESRAS